MLQSSSYIILKDNEAWCYSNTEISLYFIANLDKLLTSNKFVWPWKKLINIIKNYLNTLNNHLYDLHPIIMNFMKIKIF